MTLLRASLILALISVLWLTPIALGQTERATVSGRVTDTDGAVVAGAEIQLESIERGTTHKSITNDAGIYVLPGIQPGQYHMTVLKSGFRQIELAGLVLNVQDHVEKNFRLQIGSASESITVSGATPLVNTQDASVSTVVDRNFAENLPLNGRSFQTLIDLTPGVVVVPSNTQDNGQFSVNGQRASSNYWTVDGVSANMGVSANNPAVLGNGFSGAAVSFSTLGGTNSLVSVDAMQEFRIQTSTFAPEFGRTPGAQVSIVTRSGTNQWHGTAFDYLRNDVLDANNWFNTAVTPTLPKAKERQNDFGGTFSGPIVRDRTFFFFSYEGLRLRLPTTQLTTVPDANPADPLARQNAVSGIQPYLNSFPLPNGPQAIDATGKPIPGAYQFNASFSNPASLDAYSIRIDHNLRKDLTIFGRYNYSPSTLGRRGGGSDSLNVVQSSGITTQTGTLGITWGISSRIVNDLRLNYSRPKGSSSIALDNFGGAVPLNSLPFPAGVTTANANFFFQIFSLQPGILEAGHIAEVLQRQMNIVDSVSLQQSSHSLKFGIDFRRLNPQVNPSAYQQLVFFSDVPSADMGTTNFGEAVSSVTWEPLFRNLSVYAQDTWRIIPRLTLTYGLRWDVDFAVQSTSGPTFPALTGFNLNNLSTASVAPAGTPPYGTAYGNVTPRVGVAYQISQTQNWQTVLRGGFGVFYDLKDSQVGNGSGTSYPFGSLGRVPAGTTFPYSPTPLAPPIVAPSATNRQTFIGFDPNLKTPYTLQWNVAIEQGLGREQTLSASYVGAIGRDLLQSTFLTAPTPQISAAVLRVNSGFSNYNGLQLQFQRRLSRGLQVLASYSWAHSIDTGSAASNSNFADLTVPGSNRSSNRGPSDFDIRNAFSTGITYDIPTPKLNTVTTPFLHGWSIENFVLARSAGPVDISDKHFTFLQAGVIADVRPDLIPGQSLYLFGSQYPGGKAFNPAAFADPPKANGFPTRQGNFGRNGLRGFGAFQWDFAAHREFPIRESLKLQFRAEMFNVLNHPNFGSPSGQFGTGAFGVPNQMLAQSLNAGNSGGGALSPLYQIGGPRSIQFALKLSF